MTGQLVRVGGAAGKPLSLTIDGQELRAVSGDTVLVAALAHGRVLRQFEFDGTLRAGFCLMGACQDCWMWTESGGRLRACTTPAADGMRLLTSAPVDRSP